MYFSSFWSEGHKFGCWSSCTLAVCFLTATCTGLSRGLKGWGLSLQEVVVQMWATVSSLPVRNNSLRGVRSQEFAYCWDSWTALSPTTASDYLVILTRLRPGRQIWVATQPPPIVYSHYLS